MDNNSDRYKTPLDSTQIVYEWIQNNGDIFHNVNKRCKRTRENTIKEKPSLWESKWGLLINDPRTSNPKSFQGKRFKRRFRVPFPIFKNILVPMCRDVNLFDQSYDGHIPIEFKILVSLRILARGNCADDISEFSDIGESSVLQIFKIFVSSFVDHFYTRFVSLPKDERLASVMKAYDRLGMTGAFASMDCTHLWWDKCPHV